jgi:hypothetical protein
MNRRAKKTAKRDSAEEMIFEVWQIIKPVSADSPFNHWPPNFDAFNHWPLIVITEPEKNLSEVCMKEYGAGNFVALRLAKSRTGLPLSHWVVKVWSSESHRSLRVHPDKNYLAALRELYASAGNDITEGLYRRREAALTSLCLGQLKEPKPKESRETKPVKRAKELIRHYGPRSKSKVITQLKAEAKKLWSEEFEKGIESDPTWLDRAAKTAYESAKRDLRGRGEQRKAIKTGKKTRRT